MLKLIEFLKGKKTFIFSVCLFLTFGAEGIGLISPDVALLLKGLFGAGGLTSLRLAIK